jgi:hypothetical protein
VGRGIDEGQHAQAGRGTARAGLEAEGHRQGVGSDGKPSRSWAKEVKRARATERAAVANVLKFADFRLN